MDWQQGEDRWQAKKANPIESCAEDSVHFLNLQFNLQSNNSKKRTGKEGIQKPWFVTLTLPSESLLEFFFELVQSLLGKASQLIKIQFPGGLFKQLK